MHEVFIADAKYAEKLGAAIFESADPAADKILFIYNIYRLLAHNKLIQSLAEGQVS